MRAKNQRFYCDLQHPWLAGQAFTDVKAAKLIEGMAQPPQYEGRPRAWLFDLDSTLFSTSLRTQAILDAFLRQHPKPEARWQWLLPQLGVDSQQYKIDLTFRDLFRQLDASHADKWAAELWLEFEPFWFERFFGEHYLINDVPHAGAVEFVKQVHSLGFDIVYLTAREKLKSSFGTRETLKSHGFPLDDRTHVVMKLKVGQNDVEFKRHAAEIMQSRFEVVSVIDNEPENLAMFTHFFKQAKIVFYHSVMSHRIPKLAMQDVLAGRPLYRLFDFL